MNRTRALPLLLMALAGTSFAQAPTSELLDDAPPVASTSAAPPPTADALAPSPSPLDAPAAPAPAEAAPAAAPPAAAREVISERAVADTGRVPPRMRSASAAGPNGLDRVWSADPGPQGTLRLRLGLDWFDASDFPADGSSTQFTGSTFALAWTPIEFLEVFANLRSTSSTNTGDLPTLIQTQGDLTLGAKGGYFISDSLAVGAAAMVHLVGEPGRGGPLGDATSAEFKALFTTDLLRRRQIPFRFHLDVSYFIENGEAVYADRPDEPSLIQEWGLQVGRYDRLMLGFGFEVPASRWAVPYVEYRIGTPFLVELERRGRDSNEFAFASVPHSLTAGVRSFVLDHLAVDVTGRFGLSDQPYTGVPATPPWMLGVAVTYTLDPRPEVIEREVAAAAPPPPPPPPAPALGGLTGRVLASDTGAAPKDARVRYVSRDDLSAQATDRDGRFGGYQFAPGPVQVQATAPGYLAATSEVVVEAGKAAAVDIALKPDPALAKSKVEISVVDAKGRPVAATVEIGAPANVTGRSFSDRPYTVELAPGAFTVHVEADGYAPTEQMVTVRAGKPSATQITLEKGKGKRRGTAKAPRAARTPRLDAPTGGGGKGSGPVRRKGKRLLLKTPITFEGDTARLDGDGKRMVQALATYLKGHPKVGRVRIEAHTDNQGEAAALTRLSEQRARSVKSWLVRRGVSPKRIRVKGFGGSQPLRPNITARARQLNRRIEVKILESK